MLGFWPYHANWGEVLSNSVWSLNLWNSAGVSASHHHFFSLWLLSRRPVLNMLCMLLVCISLFPLSQDASSPVVSMDIFNSSTIKLVTSVEFSKALSSSTLIFLHGCCQFFNVDRMKRMIRTGDCLDALGNTHSIIVFV